MKADAVYFVEKGKTEVREISVSDPGPEEVQVRCLASGICMADVSVYLGNEPLPSPRMTGHEGVGIVEKIGANVRSLKEGDVVTCERWVTHFNYPAARLAKYSKLPEDPLTALAEPVECAVKSVDAYDIVPGDRVLVLGAGYMGLLNIQCLAHCPLAELVVTDLKETNRTLAFEYGATKVIDSNSEEGKAQLKEYTRTQPFDLVVESVGIQSVIEEADLYIRDGGRLAIFAWHHGHRSVHLGRWHRKGLRVLNPAPKIGTDSAIRFGERAVSLIECGVFDQTKMITHRHPYTQVAEAMELASERAEGYVKGVLSY